MSDDEEEPSESIIPQFALDVAMTGKELPKIVKRKQNDVDSNVEIEESPDEEEEKKAHSRQKWASCCYTIVVVKLAQGLRTTIALLVQSPSHLSNVRTIEKEKLIHAKKAAETPRRTKQKRSATTEQEIDLVALDDQTRNPEVEKLASLKKAMETPRRTKQKRSTTPEQKIDAIILDEEAAPDEEHEGDLVMVTPVEEVARDLEVVLEVPKTSRSKKRLRNTTPRIIQKVRSSMSVDDYQDSDYNRTAYSTPRRKVSRHRSYSPLSFKFDEEDGGVSTAPVIRRRRPSGETSIFDLKVAAEDQDLIHNISHPSTSGSVATAGLGNESGTETAMIVLDDDDSDRGNEPGGTTPHPFASKAVSMLEDLGIVQATQPRDSNGSRLITVDTGFASSSVATACEESTQSSKSVGFSSQGSNTRDRCNTEGEHDHRTPSPTSTDDEIVVLGTIERTPTKSASLTANLLYSPRKMALSNEQRRRTILAKSKNNYDIFPDLDRLVPGVDYCAFQVRSLGEDKPPLPMPGQCSDTSLSFDNPMGFVRLPWSTANINNGFHQDVIIDRALRALVNDGAHCIEAVIVTLKECAPWIKSFDGLLGFMEGLSSTEERNALSIRCHCYELIGAILSRSVKNSAHAYWHMRSFCTYRRERHSFNRINMASKNGEHFNVFSLFDGRNRLSHVKLRFILHYFTMVLKKMPTGCVSFRREVLPREALPDWENEEALMPLVAVASDGSIEDSPGCLQVDFANEYIGGGVLNSGAVQEEIRFLICPEMMVSCLLCEKMGPQEVIHIIGAQRYSSYFGYAGSLEWTPYEDFGSEPRDEFCRIKCELVAMDAKLFKPNFANAQYRKENIDRELNKAYIGFMPKQRDACPVATGNWGCGAFGGNKELKSLIQMLAAARAGRDMIYYTFANKRFEISMNELYEKLLHKKATIGENFFIGEVEIVQSRTVASAMQI
ncbi:poly glycohydrolase [Ostertagia ostertagi]